MVNTIRWEELRNVVLVGHSYGGMVITGAADRAKARGWPVHRMEGNHVPERAAPAELVELLLQLP